MKNRILFNALMAMAALSVAVFSTLFAHAAYRLIPFVPLMDESDSGWELALFLFLTVILLGVAFAALATTIHLGREAWRDFRVWRIEQSWRVASLLRRPAGQRFPFHH